MPNPSYPLPSSAPATRADRPTSISPHLAAALRPDLLSDTDHRHTDDELDQVLQLAIAGFLARHKPRTRETYAGHVVAFRRWVAAHGEHPLRLRRPHVELWLRDMELSGLASATRSSRFGAVHLLYASALADELIVRDPTAHVPRPRVHSGEQRRTWLPQLQTLALLRAAEAAGAREHVLIALLALVGMRVGEVCSIDVRDVGRSGGWRTVTYRGKGGDQYTSVVPPQAVADLELLLPGAAPDEPLLTNYWGGRLERRSVATVLRNCCAAAGITRDITPHGLRRSAVTNMLAQGIPARKVQQQVRHVDLRTTLRIYDRAVPTLDQSASLPYAASLYAMLDGE